MKSIAALILGLSFTAAIVASRFAPPATTRPLVASATAPPVPSPTPTWVSNATEVEVLRAQLEFMRAYDGRLLSTVYWALGALGTLAVLITGTSWYTNFRLYERDKESLRREIEIGTRQGIASVQSSAREAVDQRLAGLRDEMRASFASAIQESQAKVALLQDAQRHSSVQTLRIEGHLWMLRQVHRNAVTRYTEALQGALDLGASGQYDALLAEIIEAAEGAPYLSTWEVSGLARQIDRMPPEYSATVTRIRELQQQKLQPQG